MNSIFQEIYSFKKEVFQSWTLIETCTGSTWSSTLALKVVHTSLMSLANQSGLRLSIHSPFTHLILPPVLLKHLNIYHLPAVKENIHSPFAHLQFCCGVHILKFLSSFFPQHWPERWEICLQPSLVLDWKVFLYTAPPCLLTLTLMAGNFIRITKHRFCDLFLRFHEIWEMGSES